MHSFICKTQQGKIVPVESNKERFFNKLINSYGELDKKYKVSIELIEKNVNEEQQRLYKAFILKVASHFGNDFKTTQDMLKRYFPKSMDDIGWNDKPLNQWTSEDLNVFIHQSCEFLAEYGFQFEK